jgi:TolA-binding protein
MRYGRRAIVAVLVGALWLAGCAQDQKLKQQLSELQTQVNELQGTLSDINLRMEELNSSLFVLRETSRTNRDAIKKMQQELSSPTVYIDQPAEPPAPAPPVMAPPPKSAELDRALPPLPLPAGSGKVAGDEEKAFQTAVQQLDKQNWGLAVYDLNAFVAQHPNSAYLPRARYSLGEAYRRLAEHAQAAREYERCLAAGETAGPYAPRSLFWLIQCYTQLGLSEKAQQAQKRLLHEYPDSPEAKKTQLESPR